jgi:2-keto-4-pentenoate hydratase/2-oxohepta-3-ene-1,7-dioic acid hydratase in catechol pathway
MKLVRFQRDDGARVGVYDGAGILDLTPHGFSSVRGIVEDSATALDWIGNIILDDSRRIPIESTRLLAPIERPGKYLAIGMNYRAHVDESARIGLAAPKGQLWFNKQTTCISGPYDDIEPGVTEKLDYEVELGVVIGSSARYVSVTQAKEYVFGYFVANDVSARDWQFHSSTFTIGKSFDTHGPIGPWIVTADEIVDPHRLPLRTLVNGELRQESDTSKMIFNIWDQISYLSTAFTLEPGDLIATGTPEGVGVGMQPPRFLEAGDIVRCEIDGIGAIVNQISGRNLTVV